MTLAQTAALDQITEIMREHFDSAIFAFETDAEKDDDPTLCHLSFRTTGTHCQARGLLEYIRDKMRSDE